MTATAAPWFSALAPYVERADLTVALTNPFLRPTGVRVDSVPRVVVRFPLWRGAAVTDARGQRSGAWLDGIPSLVIASWKRDQVGFQMGTCAMVLGNGPS